MITLTNKDTGAAIGEISEEQLQVLVRALEEEHRRDRDYWIDHATVDMIEANHPGAGSMIGLLRQAIGASEGVEIAY
jgi:hypothetical protein